METIILGIDPGTLVMGYGLVAAQGKTVRMLTMDVLKLSPKMDSYERLHQIHQKVSALIQTYQPTAFAIEAPFFGKNVQSMLKLGRAQGVAIAAAMHAGLTVREYPPKTVKQVITGKGNADKEQVWKMLQHILGFEARPEYLDASDGLAVALCHHYQANSIEGTTGGRRAAQKAKAGWGAYIQENPGRVKGPSR